jgi:hypothetical protein
VVVTVERDGIPPARSSAAKTSQAVLAIVAAVAVQAIAPYF